MKRMFNFIKFNTLAWLVLIVAAAYGLYMVKYRVLNVQREIASIERQLEQEQENLHVLQAEWAYLTRPDRLQHLAENNTTLMPVQGVQVIALNALPFPAAPDAPQLANNTPQQNSEHPTGNIHPASVLMMPED